MRTLIMKFGGASVASPQHFSNVAQIILHRKSEYDRIAVVVSAMGDTTDDLIDLAYKVNPHPPKREYDMLITVGERISASLLTMALFKEGVEAMSFTGSQAGIITCDNHSQARIIDVRPHRILPHLSAGKVIVLAGFQGVSRVGEITTLGRGGSDTTAVALGVALQATKVEFYKDVPGIYDKNPKLHMDATLMARIDYQKALDIVLSSGAEVLHPRCIQLALRNALQLHVLSFKAYLESQVGTLISDPELTRLQAMNYEII